MPNSTTHRCSLYEALGQVVELRGGATAVTFEGSTLSYAQLKKRIDQTADALRVLGIGSGSVFSLYGRNSLNFLYCYFAAAKIGATFVPINANVTEPEVSYIVEHSGARILFYDDFVAGVASAASLNSVAKPITVLQTVEHEHLRFDYQPVDASTDVLIVYTSGSTGTPKAVILDHIAQIDAAKAMSEMWSFSSADSTVVAAPMGFLLGLSTASVVPLLAGIKQVIIKRFHPGEVLDALVQSNASVFHGVPTMFSMMLDFAEQQGRDFDLSGMRLLICSGAPMPAELVQRFSAKFGKAPQNYFGMTECYPLAGTFARDAAPLPAGAVGRLALGAEVMFVDDMGNVCPPGRAGEMYARAASMLKRYHKDKALTASSLVDGWFKTGDCGYISDGYVYISGRLKDLIIRGGANIAPLEVENALAIHPAVQSASVVGVPDRLYGEVPAAFVVLTRGGMVSGEELIAFVKAKLADFKVPTRIVFREQLPLGKTGKVDKIKLKEIWQNEFVAGC